MRRNFFNVNKSLNFHSRCLTEKQVSVFLHVTTRARPLSKVYCTNECSSVRYSFFPLLHLGTSTWVCSTPRFGLCATETDFGWGGQRRRRDRRTPVSFLPPSRIRIFTCCMPDVLLSLPRSKTRETKYPPQEKGYNPFEKVPLPALQERPGLVGTET